MEEDGTVLAEERNCALDATLTLGREMDPLLVWERRREVVSGWARERIKEKFVKEECVEVGEAVLY